MKGDPPDASRHQLCGVAAIEEALASGRTLRRVLVARESATDAAIALADLCIARGVPVRDAAPRELARLARSPGSDGVLALEGPAPDAPLADVLAGPGAVWLLCDVAYPGNAGFAIRTAEVSGAAGIAIDAGFDHAERRQALRVSMRADRVFPVHFAPADDVASAARDAGRRVIGIEDAGDAAPWDVDLLGRVLFVVGGEARGIPPGVLAACGHVVSIPMAGFVPSYNLQAAVAIVAGERLRQAAQRGS